MMRPVSSVPHVWRWLAALAAALVVNAVAHAQTTTTFNGAVTNSSPSFVRPRASNGGLTGTGPFLAGSTSFAYFTQSITPTVTGSYTLEVTSSTISDSVLVLYSDPFDPAQPTVNGLAIDDDSAGGLRPRISNVTLTANTTYTIVVTVYNPGETGTVNFSVAGAGSVGLSGGPTVTNVAATSPNNTYVAGNTVNIAVTFSAAVTVTGTPQLTLALSPTNRVASYTGPSGSDTLIFSYVVQAGDSSSDLDYASTGALSFNGGSITNSVGTVATLTLPAPGAAGSLGANSAIVIGALATAPSIIVSPSTQSVSAGTPVTFSVVAAGSTPFSYQWYFNGAAISGATSSSYSISNPQSANAGNYSVAVTNSSGTAISDVGTLTINAGPAVASITAKAGRIIEFGANATLTATATGSGPFTYQWYRNGSLIGGATSAGYSITHAKASDAGDYTVSITNSIGNVTSSTIAVTIATVGSGTGPITIATNSGTQVSGNVDSSTGVLTGSVTTGGAAVAPQIAGVNSRGNLLVEIGSTATLSVAASGNPAPTYQWYKNSALLSGQTAPTLTLSNAQIADAGQYSVVVTNSGGSISSDTLGVTVAQLGSHTGPITIATSGGTQVAGNIDSSTGILTGTVTVSGGGTAAPRIDGISSKSGLLLEQGASTTLTVAASGNPAPSYQWLKNGSALSGQTGFSLSLTNVQPADAGSYSVRATNSSGTVTSNAIPVTIVQVGTGTGPISIAGGNGTVVQGTVDSSGNLSGSVTSGGSGAAVAPQIAGVSNRTDLLIKTGGSATLTVNANGSPAPTYQWYKDGAALSGQTNSSLTLANASAAQAGSYSVRVTNSAGSATSDAIGVTVAQVPSGSGSLSIATSGGTQVAGTVDSSGILSGSVTANASAGAVAPRIDAISSGSGILVSQGGSATLSVSASGSPAPTFQWLKNGTEISGQTGSTLSFTNAQPSDAGTYSVRATNSSGAVTSASAIVTVIQIGSGTGPITIAGGNGTTVNGTIDSSGALTGSATTGAPGAVSAPKIAGISSKADLLVSLGDSATLTVFATGTPVPTYQWYRNGQLLAGQTGDKLVISNAQTIDAGNYTVTATNSAGVVTSSVLAVTVAQLGSGTGPITIATSGGTKVDATVDSSGSLTGSLTLDAGNAAQAPRISSVSSTPGSLLVQRGSSTTLSVNAAGNPAPSYQWYKDGAAISGATAPTFTITTAAAKDAGTYTVKATNATGTATSTSLAVTVGNIGGDNQIDISTSGGTVIAASVDPATGIFSGGINTGGVSSNRAPQISAVTSNPSSVAAEAGATATLHAIVTGSPEPTYQWYKNGTALSGQTDEMLTLANIQPSNAGNYTVKATNSAGAVTSGSIEVTVYSTGANGQLAATNNDGSSIAGTFNSSTGGFSGTVTNGVFPPAISTSRLTNLSARTNLAAGRSITAGIVVTGSGRRQVLVRAVGPGLAKFGLSGVLADPKVQVLRGSTVIATNAGVGQSGVVGDIAQASARVGAFALAPSGTDAALLTSLEPGNYSVVVSSASGAGGQVLVELYDPNAVPNTTAKFANFSSMTPVAANDILFGGFAVAGNVSKRVLIRAVGPTLNSGFGVGGVMPKPVLKVLSGSTVVAENRGWTNASNATEISTAAGQVGAFALGSGSNDSALVLTLQPGSYKVQVTDANGAAGTALIEFYELP